jgi:hypothetical protein
MSLLKLGLPLHLCFKSTALHSLLNPNAVRCQSFFLPTTADRESAPESEGEEKYEGEEDEGGGGGHTGPRTREVVEKMKERGMTGLRLQQKNVPTGAEQVAMAMAQLLIVDRDVAF